MVENMATRVSVASFCYVYIIGKTLKILSETARPRALIFGMVHHLVDLYQICSNNGPWAKSGPVLGSHVLKQRVAGLKMEML